MPGPRRIVCLTAETTELAFGLGCADRIVGVTGYAVRPPQARLKPRVAAFSTAHLKRITSLEPDLVLGFSDLQADIARDLIRLGIPVLITNQRSLDEIYDAILVVAGALGERKRGEELVAGMRGDLDRIRENASTAPSRPRVYFEEWDDPLISGIRWVGDLIALCGGVDVFEERRAAAAAARIIDPRAVIDADPQVIVASWCGKKANLGRIRSRPGWEAISAVRNRRVYEIKSADILQPGLSVVHGARQLAAMIAVAAAGEAYAHTPGLDAK